MRAMHRKQTALLAIALAAASSVCRTAPLEQAALQAAGPPASARPVQDDRFLVTDPQWAPDGSRLLFTSARDGQPEVYVMAADGSGATRLTRTPGGQSRRAEWSPDGAWISFGTNRDGNEEIYLMRPDGSALSNVSRDPAREYYSRWHPGGRRLLFTSNRERRQNAIYEMAADGSGVRRIFPAAPGAAPERIERIEQMLLEAFAPDRPGGVVLVARSGARVFERAYGLADLELGVPVRPDHVFLVGSIAKQFTAVAVLQLVEAGRLRLNDDVRRHLPGFPTHGRTITVEQVLTHTSGLPNLVDLDDFETVARQDHNVGQLLGLTRDVPLWFEPGTSFRYSDTGYILLGAIIERLSGLSYGDYIEQRIARPLGLMHIWYADDVRIIPGRVSGYSYADGRPARASYISMTVPHAAGGLAASAGDIAAWHHALQQERVVSRALLERAWAGRTLPNGVHSGYGYGWKVCSIGGRRTVEHGGFVNGFGANAIHLPDEELTIVALVNQDADVPDAGAIARRVARTLLTGTPDPRYVELTPGQRAALAGRYRRTDGNEFEIVDTGHGLVRRMAGADAPLSALSPTRVTLAESEGAYLFEFEPGPDGLVAAVRSSLRCEPGWVAKRRVDDVGTHGARRAVARRHRRLSRKEP